MPVPNRITIDGSSLPDRYLSRTDAATFCGVSEKTLACWASLGVGPRFSKLSDGRSGATRYSLAELQTFMRDPASYRPRPVVRFNKPASVKRGGQPNVSIARARRKRHGSANKSG